MSWSSGSMVLQKPKTQTSCLKLHPTDQVGVEGLEGIIAITRTSYKTGLFLIQIYAFYLLLSGSWDVILDSYPRLLLSSKGL